MNSWKSRLFTQANTFGKKVISASDYFASQPQLRIQRQKKFSTTLGATITYCIITICIFQLISQLQDILERNNPNVITSEFQLFNTDEYLLHPHNFTMAIALMDARLQPMRGQNKYYNISIMNCKRQRFINETTGQTTAKLDCYQYPVEECTEEHFPSEFQKQYFKTFNKSGLYCPKINDWNQRPLRLQGVPQADVFQYIDVFIYKCKNNTQSQNCSSDQQISQQLSGNYLAIHSSDVLAKMLQSQNSFEDIIQAQYYYYSVGISKTTLSQLRIIEALSDIALLTTNIQKQQSLQQSAIKETSDSYNNQYFFKYGIIIDQRMTQYTRTYLKLQNAFSNIGGLWQVLCLIAQIFLSPFTSYLTEVEMANEYFRFEGKNNHQQKKKQKSFFIPQEPCQEVVEEEIPNTTDRALKDKQKQMIQSNRLENSIDIQKFLNYQQIQQKMPQDVTLKLAICCNKQKKKQINYAIDKVVSKLDVLFIIQKLQELDKLKYLLLSKDQLNLFNYIPKPLIPFSVFESEFIENIQNLEKKIAYKLILDEEKSETTKIKDAFTSYQNLKIKQNLSKTDKQILEFLDDEIKLTFDQLFVQNFKGLESRDIRPIFDMESICESRLPVKDSINEG